jgi:transposase-like protein
VSRRRRRRFTRHFKLSALKRMTETENIQVLAQELRIERRLPCRRWDAQAFGGEAALRLDRIASRSMALSRILTPRRRATKLPPTVTCGSTSGTNVSGNKPGRVVEPSWPDPSACEEPVKPTDPLV